ncbi:phospholipase-like protein [Tanacetum coccineum]
MIRTESGRMITKNIDDMTIAEYMEYEAEMKREVSSDEDVDEWLNEELSKRMTGQDKEEEDDTLIDILKTVGVSFVAEEMENKRMYLQKRSISASINEIKPRKFTLFALLLANLKKTSMVGDMTKKAPLGIVENIPVKIDKFLFYSDFVVIDTLEGPNETILLGRPFLATIHAQIDIFRGEISLGVGNEKVKFDMNGEICHSRVPLEKIYMASSIQESEYFNPHEMENDDSPALEQRTFHYGEEIIDTIDSSSDSQENEVGSHLSENVSKWHVCKPVHITFKACEEDCEIWPTCNPDLSFCSGQNVRGNRMKFDDFLKVRYGNKNIDDVTRERRYYEWVAQNYDFKVKSQRTTKYTDPYDLHHKSDSPPNDTLRINTYFPDVSQTQPEKSHIRENSFEEWMKIKLGHTNISDSMRCVMFKEWVKEDFNFGVNIGRTKDDLYSRNFDVYKDEFDKEIKFSLQRNGIQGLLDSCLCGRKVLHRRNHKGYAITDVITACVPWKPSRDFTRPLRAPSGLKGLLHMLNATVIPTKGK